MRYYALDKNNNKIFTNMNKKYTLAQINKKYKGKYIEITRYFDYELGELMFTVHKVSSVIRENTTLGEDVGTELAYRR